MKYGSAHDSGVSCYSVIQYSATEAPDISSETTWVPSITTTDG